ncbi:hypothetical protein FK535_10340 [Mycolicibacterium sp. 018/SC-01/001]|uniref:LGFP repeat-containing protein n=1 Tax=Mycolicibacterium sp. 018/SC-01/001 TaxID=2592069 RepID=UPI0011804AA6|nr:LGFP repeat-containing protein [Mycolicibacterium sp. 018/SC-01/001]TRW84871.1 hypothetical protein FK535_10340 [Mycolicibacterium sp. 018/SC-01/001]
MTRQPMLRRRGSSRWAIGLLGVAAALLLSPVAAAQPDVDAGNAITATWQATGGDTGPLGSPAGGVYPIGAGFAQDFASGKVFFTPATGAHVMQGAILDKYESLGGPADSDLGFPTIDEGPGRAPDSRNSTFSASDNPVIFWTPDTGAHVVRGPINAAWDKLGGSSGVLGVPAEDETYDGPVVSQKFTGGQISYDARAKKFTTDPTDLAGQLSDVSVPDDPIAAINAARRAAGGQLGPLGASEGEPYKIGSDGMGQDFVNGKIFYSPATGANVVTGQVLAKYESVGGPEGDLGFPVSGEVDGGIAPASRMSSFAAADKPVIFWTPDYGAVIVRGAMAAAWEKLGGATGALGAPVDDQTQSGDAITQKFSGGAITYDTAAKRFSTEPANLASQLAGLQVPGQQETQAAPSAQGGDSGSGSGVRWAWWWLLAIIPVLLILAVVGVAVARRRRGGHDDDSFAVPSYEHDAHDDYDDQPDDVGEDALFGDRYAREGLGSVAPADGRGTPPEGHDPSGLGLWGVTDSSRSGEAPFDEQDDPDSVDTAPTRIPSAADHDAPQPDTAREWAGEESDGEEHHEFDGADDGFDGTDGASDHAVAASALGAAPVAATDIDHGFDRDALHDTGRHARIDDDEIAPMGTALHLPLDDPEEIPDGYPIKADTRSGLYWSPDSADYDEARAEIWFATEEIARTNGFVRGS